MSRTTLTVIWPYVAAIPPAELQGHALVDGCVEHVYRNASNTFDHVLIVTKARNIFLVVVVDLVRDAILGHHLLDLNREYGVVAGG